MRINLRVINVGLEVNEFMIFGDE